MKIIHLKSENVQRVKVVEISPDGQNLVVIGGNNGHGKTSVLDSIMFALGGKKSLSQKPVREGADEGVVSLETEDFSITRTIKPNGNSELEVKKKDGVPVSSPQKLLESLTSKLTFDPLAFASMEQKAQVNVIKSLIPFDFSGNETYRKSVYDERTYLNRELKAKKAENEANPFDPTVPVDELPFDTSELTSISEQQIAKNTLEQTIRRGHEKIETLAYQRNSLLKQIEEIETEAQKIVHWINANEPKLKEFGNLDELVSQATTKNEELHQRNHRIRKNADAKKIYGDMKGTEAKVNELSQRIEKLDADKMSAIEAADLPVDGLSFSDDVGVQFRGIPFTQLSGAQRLKVSLAMGIALNPELRILLIRDGSLLDSENLKVVSEMANQFDMQVWLERVGKGEECSVIIEDGMVSENRTVKAGEGACEQVS